MPNWAGTTNLCNTRFERSAFSSFTAFPSASMPAMSSDIALKGVSAKRKNPASK